MKDYSKILSLMRFQDSYLISPRGMLFENELKWVFQKTGSKPEEALFISYAYLGNDYPAYFSQVSDIFKKQGVKLTDITSGNPEELIANARFIVIGGGDIGTFYKKMDSLITPAFNPYLAILDSVQHGVPYMGWNEGSGVISPKYFMPPANALLAGINGSPFEIICNYPDSPQSDAAILNFLLTNTTIPEVAGQPQTSGSGNEGSVRLEETGGGIILTPTVPFPFVIRYKVVNGVLIKN